MKLTWKLQAATSATFGSLVIDSWKSKTVWLSGIVLRDLEDGAAFDFVPPQMYESD